MNIVFLLIGIVIGAYLHPVIGFIGILLRKLADKSITFNEFLVNITPLGAYMMMACKEEYFIRSTKGIEQYVGTYRLPFKNKDVHLMYKTKK